MDWGSSIPEYLANAAIRSLGLAMAAGAALWLLRVRSAAARHGVWTLVTAAMLALVALNPLLPPLPLRILRPVPALNLAVAGQAEEPEIALSPRAGSTPISIAGIAIAPAPPARRRITWQQAAAAIYLCGALVFLAIFAASYRYTRRLVRAGRIVDFPGAGEVRESNWITVPVTVGWRLPRILLPAEWPQWPAEKLKAVMTHERAHVERGDWAIAVIAGLNRCLFWFHPLAWWLERRLSTLAEEAADDAAVLTLGAPAGYAQTLLEMAMAVRADRGRMVKEAMAMAKTAEVRQRIERILDETRQIPRGLTRARWVVLSLCGVPLIYVAAAVQVEHAAAPVVSPVSSVPYAVNPAPPVRAVVPPGVVFRASVAAPAAPEEPPQEPTPAVPKFTETVAASSQYPFPYRDFLGSTDLVVELEPPYPQAALAAGVEGDVVLRVVIGTDGHVIAAQPVSGHPLLVPAALDAARHWAYRIQSRGRGEAVEFEGQVRIGFHLPGSSGASNPPAGEIRAITVDGTVTPVGFGSANPPTQATPAAPRPPGLSYPVLLSKAEPVYPVEKRAAGIQGSVELSLTVGVSGAPLGIQVTKSLDPALDQDALEAVGRWKFMPAKQDGVPVETPVSTEVNYRLVGPEPSVRTAASPGPGIAGALPPGHTVTLLVQVGVDGKPSRMQIMRSVGMGMDAKAMDAVSKWAFQPVYQSSQPIAYTATVDVEFN